MRGEDRGRRMRHLSESERALWRKVQRSVRPLHGPPPPPPPPPLPPDPAAGAGAPGRSGETGTAHTASSAARSAPASRAGSAGRGGTQPPAAAGGSPGTVAPQPPAGAPRLSRGSAPAPAAASPSDIDRKTRRGLARGSVPVEARLDLHGLTQADAYRELRRFLVHAQARGLRHVLVITGKGRRPNETGEGGEGGEGGVLRRAVPEWLRQPELRPYVAMVGAAATGHGGDGALYLRLARRAGPRRR